LNAYGTKDAVLDAVRNLPYKGGNTLTGMVYVLAFAFHLKTYSAGQFKKR